MRTVGFSCLLCVAAAAAPARAQEKSYETSIRDAVTEFNAGSWHEARILFRRAHELQPSARTWRGLGLTAYELRLYVDAIAELEAALADSRRPLTQEQRTEAEATLAKARRFAAVYRLEVPEGVESVVVDGQPQPIPPDRQLYLNPGTHTVAIRLPGHAEDRKQIDAEPGVRDELVFTLTVAGPPDESNAEAPPVLETPSPSPSSTTLEEAPARTGRLWTWIAAGAAGVFLASGVTFGLLTNSEFDDVDRFARSCSPACERAEIETRQEDGKSYQLLTNLSFALAGVAAAGAVTLYVLEGDDDRPAVSLGPGQVMLRGSF